MALSLGVPYDIGNGFTATISHESGNTKPYRAHIYGPNGYVGVTGACKSIRSALNRALIVTLTARAKSMANGGAL